MTRCRGRPSSQRLLEQLRPRHRHHGQGEPLAVEDQVGGGVGEERVGPAFGLTAVNLHGVEGVLAIVSNQSQVSAQREGPLAAPAEGPGQMVGEGGVDPSFERVEVEQLGREGGRERLFAGRLGEAPAGLVDRGHACGSGEQDGQDDLSPVTLPTARNCR